MESYVKEVSAHNCLVRHAKEWRRKLPLTAFIKETNFKRNNFGTTFKDIKD